MFETVDISSKLRSVRAKERNREEELVAAAKKILHDDLFSKQKVLEYLGHYSKRFETLNEDTIDSAEIFTAAEIKTIATRYRLKLLERNKYQAPLPHEADLRVAELNRHHKTELKHFYVLSYPQAFKKNDPSAPAILFTKTNHDNFYLVSLWGKKLPFFRKLLYWPMRNFENLLLTIICFTLLVTLVLPTKLITLDAKATYWCGYRAAAFMHLLIFNAGITTYITFAFSGNFSSTVWNRKKDFD